MTQVIIYCCLIHNPDIWSVISALSSLGLFFLTLYIVFYAKEQLKTSNETSINSLNISKADFSLRFENNFFTEKSRELFFLFENDLLNYKMIEDKLSDFDLHYFEIDIQKLEKYPILKEINFINNKNIIVSNDVDDLLLNHFEDLGIYEEEGLLSLNFVYEGFVYYLKTIWENKQVNKYIKTIR